MGSRVNSLFARHALLADGWASDVRLCWNDAGWLTEAQPGAAPQAGEEAGDWVIPGMVNLHSHAFQRAMAGLSEIGSDHPDSFWSWRALMYRFAGHLTPEHIEAIAAQLFSECLRHGYTALCEFHYLQRERDGAWYARPAEMAERVAGAARATGIGLTLLPVLYSHAGFGKQPLSIEQRRFRTGPDDVLRIVEALEPLRGAQLEVGAAPHSLRAAGIDQIRALAAAMPPGRPLHIHLAEQRLEVEQCLHATGQRPLRHLFDGVPVDPRWCLVHATHLSDDERAALAASGAVAGLCPTTEANLGDGIFPLAAFLADGGRFGIGSDSHVSQSPVEELRWLEYGQRLVHGRRNVASVPGQRQVGEFLWRAALAGGAQACGRAVGALARGRRADLLVLDGAHPNLADCDPPDVSNRLLFCGNDNLVKNVLVGGRWVVRDHRHVAQAEIAQRYRQTLAQLRTLRTLRS
jgi:formimidoylglutamate deiminase